MEPMIATVMGPCTAGGHAPFLLDADLRDYVRKETISTITQWLQYPKEKTISAVQGKFVNMLLTITNSYDIFLLNATWKAYCFPKLELFNNRKLKQFTNNRIADTCDKLKELPVTQSGSREIQAIRDIAKMCRPFGAISKNSNPNTLATTVAEFVHFLRDLMPTTQSLISQSSDNNLIRKVIKRPDFYMPFQEIAPSQRRVKGPQGPFEHNFIRTRTTAESDPHNNHFEDLNAYISYCCNNQFKAYGTPNHKRHPKLAITFWKATEGWETFIKSNQGEIPFNAMHEYLTRLEEGQNIFPQIGDLTGYLMAVDLCYTGLVQWPTAYELGQGFYSEMVVQGLIDGKSDHMDCGRAFRDFNDKSVPH
ncbi:hypothetical protein K439DRAFT_1619964 [Ramaria rubella]|nr:hypothetical protein K439DRAFT_1619964 [Ramaria rubella]